MSTTTPAADRPGRKRRDGADAVRVKTSRRRNEGVFRQTILEAALQVFSTQGYDGASIGSIASACGGSAPSIHYHFENKSHLWKAAVEFAAGNAITDLKSIMDDLVGVDSLSRLTFFLKRYIGLMSQRKRLFEIVSRENEARSERVEWLVASYLRPLMQMLNDVIVTAQKDGHIKLDVPAPHICQLISGACYHFFADRPFRIALYGDDSETDTDREHHAHSFLAHYFAGLRDTSAT